VIDGAKSDLVRILLEPQRIAGLAAADVPTLLGDLERVRAALWDRMLRGSRAETPTAAGDADEVLTVPDGSPRAEIHPRLRL
jgi:hypothetical protein